MTRATVVWSPARAALAVALLLATDAVAAAAQSPFNDVPSGSFTAVTPAAVGGSGGGVGFLFAHDASAQRNNAGMHVDWSRARFVFGVGFYEYDRAPRLMTGVALGSVLLQLGQDTAASATIARIGVEVTAGVSTDSDTDGWLWGAGLGIPVSFTPAGRRRLTLYLTPGAAVVGVITFTEPAATLAAGARAGVGGGWTLDAGARRIFLRESYGIANTVFGAGVTRSWR